MKKLIFVTGNHNKFQEIRSLFQIHLPNIELIQGREVPLELQSDSLEVVAGYKVQSVMDRYSEPYFVEDAGFFVDDQLHGFPGVYSSYVMKSIGWQGILKILGTVEPRKAHFEAVIALCDEKRHVRLFKGINHGTVAYEGRGQSGFGFDPIFISNDTPGKTFAELSMEQKNKVSHRSRALMQLITYLQAK